MLRFRGRTISVLLAATTALAVVGLAPTAASAAPTGADPDIARSLQRIAAGNWTADDLRQVRRDPAVAKVVIDPSTVTVTSTSSGAPTRLSGQRGTDGASTQVELCGGWVDITIRATTILGFDFLQWVHHLGYCSDGTYVTRLTSRYDGVLYADPTLYVRELVVNSVTGAPAGRVTSVMQRHFEQCVIRYGCFANYYPWSSIMLNGNNTYTYNWGVG